MTSQQSQDWKEQCIRWSEFFAKLHFQYSSSEGWLYVTPIGWKQNRERFDYTMSKETIEMALYRLTQ